MKFYLRRIAVVFAAFLLMIIAYWIYDAVKTAAFLSELKGDVVFTKRDGLDSNVYTISADGKNLKRVFANDDPINKNSVSPKWIDDKTRIRFAAMKNGVWKTFTINASGGDVQISDDKPDMISRHSMSDDIKIRSGDVLVGNADGGETKVYSFHTILGYDRVLNSGASEASWSSDKQHVIFHSCSLLGGCDIIIADKNGQTAVKLTNGSSPDWK
ncbi:MAG: hypothetical protein H7Z37_02410 [Pyrinomonadaceae bacterium]|nr:hypothetical protein [Pyrinomonadaceae bacterium]